MVLLISRYPAAMTRARHELISLPDTPYYHCIARCVRRAFLCGVDPHTGEDFSHRRAWVIDRLRTLSNMFAIDVCSYAIMQNHYHLVLKADAARAQAWSLDEVIAHWNVLFASPELVKQYQAGQLADPAILARAITTVNELRERLSDISWYMRTLNEHIARRANAEDDCTGRFWEGRFRSQALLDDQALLTCMTYVDLNPIRAGLADTPETSAFTSASQRIAEVAGVAGHEGPRQQLALPRYPLTQTREINSGPEADASHASCPLLDFIGGKDSSAGIPFQLKDYLELVDWSGRSIRPDKLGAIAANTPAILSRLGIDDVAFLQFVARNPARDDKSRHVNCFATAIGTPARLKQIAVLWCRKFFKGMSKAQRLFPVTSDS
jgi:putative transposase